MPNTVPLNLSDGVYVLQSRVIDNADNQAQNAVAINIDTTAPTISGTLAGTLGANNWYISSVQAAVSVSDITSGIASTEYSADGGAWANYTTPISFASGGHQIQFRTTDTAGLLSETEIFDFKIDSSAPEIHLPSRWYIWESGTFTVKDAGSKIISVSYQIRDSQNRWKKVERNWTPDRTSFSHTISWNRLFADGITAPIGTYDVIIYAENEAGNRSQKSAQIIIPQPNATALPTFTPTPTATNTPLTTPTATVYNAPLIVPTATQTPFVFLPPEPRETEENNGFFSFFSAPNQLNRASQSTTPSSPTPSTGSGNILWGATAAAALGAFNAVIAEKKRKEAEARWRANIRRNSDYMKMREAEKAGQLDEYLREKNMTESERKHRRELQAIWDANGAAIYEQKKAKVQKEAKRVVARQELHEKQLKHKIDFLEPPPPPPEPSLAEVQARMEKEKQLEQEQALADWKKADMGADSGVVAMRKEVEREERKPWWKKTWETVKEKTQKFASNLSSAAASVLSPRKNVGAYKMASLVADDPPPPVSEDCWWPWVCRTVDKFKDWFSKDKKKQPAPTPNTNATAINMAQTMAAGMQTAQPTSTPIPTATPTLPPTFTPTATPDPSRIDGPLSIEQIPPEFRCTLEEEKVINGIMYVSDYYSMCKTGEYFIEQILTDENGWWWEDGISLDGKSEWDAIKKTEDVWKLALTISLDSEGTTVRRDIPAFSEPFSTAMHNKFWHFDHGVQPSYQNRIDDPAPSLGYNGRLTFLGSLDSINIRTSDMKTGLSASNVIKEPYDGWITNNWQTAQEAINNIVWPEPDWTMPNKHEPYDWANARLMMEAKPKLVLTMTAILNAEIGTDYNQVYYMSSGENSIQILTAEQKEFFYAKSSK